MTQGAIDQLPTFRWRRSGSSHATAIGRSGRPRRGGRVIQAAAVVVALGLGGVAPVAAAGSSRPLTQELPAPEASATLAESPPVRDARARLDGSIARAAAARASLDALEWQAVAVESDRAALSAEQQQLALDLRDARARAREAMVAAYIGGRPADLTTALLTTTSASDLAFRTELLTRNLEQRTATVRTYVELDAALDGQTREVGERGAAVQLGLEAAREELGRAEAAVAVARSEVEVAESQALIAEMEAIEVQRRSNGGRYVAAGSDGSPTPAESGNADGLAWDLLRRCESGGNYAAVNPTGSFRGAYQFHQTTWEMLGGVGDPIDALTAEQDYRAQLLYDMLGAKPWPQCGRYLRMSEAELAAIVSGIPATTTTTAPPVDASSTSSGPPRPSSTTSPPRSTSTSEAPTATRPAG